MFGHHLKILEFCGTAPEDTQSLRCAWKKNDRHDWPGLRTRLEEYFTLCKPLMRSGECRDIETYVDEHVDHHLMRLNEVYDWDFLASTLLLYAPNLESITFLWSGEHHKFNTLAFLDNAGRLQRVQAKKFKEASPFSFPRLREVKLAPRDDMAQKLAIFDVRPVIEIDSLINLSCDGIPQILSFFGSIDDPILIQGLTLTKCGLTAFSLNQILRKCTKLQQFHLGYASNNIEFYPRPSLLFRSLLHLADTLVSLTILDDDNWHDQPRHKQDQGILPCLRGFTKLQSLEIRSELIFTKRVLQSTAANDESTADPGNGSTKAFTFSDLPASLMYLNIRHTPVEIIDHFLAIEFDALPNLKSVLVSFVECEISIHDINEADLKDWSLVGRVYGMKGIVVSFHYYSYYDDEGL